MTIRERGTLPVHSLDSSVLASNPLGDPEARDLHLYLPPGDDPARRDPALPARVKARRT